MKDKISSFLAVGKTFLLGILSLIIVACSQSPAVMPSPTPIVIAITSAPTSEPKSTPTQTPESTPTVAVEPTPTPAATARADAQDWAQLWEDDIAYFRERLVDIHPNPFYRVPAAEYDRALDQLRAELPAMSDAEIIVALARIVAYIDGHSAINVFAEPANFHLYPLHLYSFSDGLYVIDALEPYAGAIGGQVVMIGATPIDEALATIRPYVSYDNALTVQHRAPYWLIRPELLLALGLIDSAENPLFVVEMADGSRQTLNPAPLTSDAYNAWRNGPPLGLLPRSETLYLSRMDENFWFTYLEDSGTLYIQYNQVRGGISAFADEIRDFLEQQEVERVVLDMRLNPGGNNTTYGPFLELLSSHPAINRPGHFFTILGRQTFSAAANFATELENRTHTIFVGEAMGGSPNLYGDVIALRLPNSGLPISISARYWEKSTPEDSRDTIAADLPAPLSAQDYFTDRDPALAAILAFDGMDGLSPAANPLLSPLSTSAWETDDIRDPYVVEVDGTYYMFYAGQDADGVPAIGYATSENGRKWFRAGGNPILTATAEGFDSHGVAAPVVTVSDGVWTLYYGAVSEPGGRTTAIGRATASSPNGDWTRSENPLLTVGESPAWDSLSITPGSIVIVAGEQRLYYNGFSADREIGVGVAISVDGNEWAKHDDPETTAGAFAVSDPILAGAEPGRWDEIVWAPFVHQRDGQWEMFYHGDPSSSGTTMEIGLGVATSSDGLRWTRAEQPFLTSITAGRFPHTPHVLEIGDFRYLYYASMQTGGTAGQIELEILPR